MVGIILGGRFFKVLSHKHIKRRGGGGGVGARGGEFFFYNGEKNLKLSKTWSHIGSDHY